MGMVEMSSRLSLADVCHSALEMTWLLWIIRNKVVLACHSTGQMESLPLTRVDS